MALQRFPDDDLRRVLCVVAHPDDMEYGASAAVATWTARGVQVAYLLITGGEAGMQSPPEVTRPIRAEEQRRACAAVGVDDLTILGHPDGMLTYSLELRRDIAREIRRFRPDAVLTSQNQVEAAWGLEQADHRAVGLAALDAVRDADNQWVFPELADEGAGQAPHAVAADHRPRGTHPRHRRHPRRGGRRGGVAGVACGLPGGATVASGARQVHPRGAG